MRWALEVQGGYLQQTISWFNFLHFTTNFAVLHSAVFIDKLWKSIFQLISAISLRKMCWFLTSVYISADFSYFSFSEFAPKSAETSNVLADFSYFPFSDFKEKNWLIFYFHISADFSYLPFSADFLLKYTMLKMILFNEL